MWSWPRFGYHKEHIEEKPTEKSEPTKVLTPKIPFDIGNDSPMTTREMCILHDYVKYLQGIYYHDAHAGYVEGMLQYLSNRLATNIGMNRFAPGDVFIVGDGK